MNKALYGSLIVLSLMVVGGCQTPPPVARASTQDMPLDQAIAMLRPAGTVCYIGLPGGKKDEIRASISAITNWELSVRGSNVGTRLDLNEAVAFAANGLVTARIKKAPLEQINAIFDDMRAGNILGRVVLKLA